MADDVVIECPAVIDGIIRLATLNRPLPNMQRIDAVRRKLQLMPFVPLLTLFFKWMWGDRDSIIEAIERDLFAA